MIRSLWFFLVLSSTCYGQGLPVAKDLQQDATALTSTQVLLVMVSQHGCSYCTLIKEDFLRPMLRNPKAQQAVMIRELKIDQTRPIIDFDGSQRSAAQVASRYSATLTPTILLLDDKGTLLAPKLVGISTPEFYGYYLDTAIESAQQARKAMSK